MHVWPYGPCQNEHLYVSKPATLRRILADGHDNFQRAPHGDVYAHATWSLRDPPDNAVF